MTVCNAANLGDVLGNVRGVRSDSRLGGARDGARDCSLARGHGGGGRGVKAGGVEGPGGACTAVRLRLAGDLCGLSETTITSFVRWRGRGLLASAELSAVGGRARLLAVDGGTAVGMPAAVQAGEGCRD